MMKKKQLLLVLVCFLPLQTQAASCAAIACILPALAGVATCCCKSVCVPFLKCCTKATNETLEREFPSEVTNSLQKIIPNPELRNIIINNVSNNYYNVVYTSRKMSPPPEEKKEEILSLSYNPHVSSKLHPIGSRELFDNINIAVQEVDSFHEEQKALTNVEMIDLNLGENIHALVFNRHTKHILFIKEAPQVIDEYVFDELFPKVGLTSAQEKEKRAMQQMARVLNEAASKSSRKNASGLDPQYPDGLYISTSGRKFYKFHHTYILPLRSDEVAPDFELKPILPKTKNTSFKFDFDASPSSTIKEKELEDDDSIYIESTPYAQTPVTSKGSTNEDDSQGKWWGLW